MRFKFEFVEYIRTGILPQSFSCESELLKFIKNKLTSQERADIKNLCILEFEPKSDWHPYPRVWNVLPRALMEGAVCSTFIAALTYKKTDNLSAALKSSAITGIFYVYQRCFYANIGTGYEYLNYKKRFAPYSHLLSNEHLLTSKKRARGKRYRA